MASGNSFPEQSATLGALLRAPYRQLTLRLYETVAEMGFPEIRPAHSAVFRHIAAEGSRLTDMAELANITKQSMSYLVDSLREQGYVELRPDPADGRARLVVLTAKGERLMEVLLKASAALETELAGILGREAVRALRDQLHALNRAVSLLPPRP